MAVHAWLCMKKSAGRALLLISGLTGMSSITPPICSLETSWRTWQWQRVALKTWTAQTTSLWLHVVAGVMGLRINQRVTVDIREHLLDSVDKFTYLRSPITSKRRADEEVETMSKRRNLRSSVENSRFFHTILEKTINQTIIYHLHGETKKDMARLCERK